MKASLPLRFCLVSEINRLAADQEQTIVLLTSIGLEIIRHNNI